MRVWVSASAIVRDWASVRVWVMVTWGSVGHGDVRVRGSARRERVGESRRRVGNALFSVTPLTRSVSGECVGYGGCPCLCASKMRYYGSEAAVRRADPFSVNFYLCTINRKLRETLRIVKKKDRDGELLC